MHAAREEVANFLALYNVNYHESLPLQPAKAIKVCTMMLAIFMRPMNRTVS